MNNLEIIEKLDRIEKHLLSTKKVFNIEDLSLYSGMAVSHIYKLTYSLKIPFSKPGGKLIFFDKEEIDKWLLGKKIKSVNDIEIEALDYISKNKKG